LSYGISRGHGKFSVNTLLRLQHFSGICLIIAGLFAGGNIAMKFNPNNTFLNLLIYL